jgi:hypothetical protein
MERHGRPPDAGSWPHTRRNRFGARARVGRRLPPHGRDRPRGKSGLLRPLRARSHRGWSGQSHERWPPIGRPLPPSRPPRRRTADLMALELRCVGLLEQRPPVQEVRLAHREGLIRGGRLAVEYPGTLGLMVHRHVRKLTGRTHGRHQPADCGPLVTRPASEIQDHVGSKPQRLQTKPEQPSFQHIALPLRLRVAEQRDHPLIRRQPQSAVLLGQLPSSRRLSGPWQADRQEQRRHTQILSRRPRAPCLTSLTQLHGVDLH